MLGRCFIAVNIPDNKKEKLIPLLKELKEAEVRTVIPKNVHFTLKFLGEIKPDAIQKIIEKLSKIEFTPFEVKLKGVGAFPNENYVKVVWAGAQSAGMEKLADKINSKLEELFPKENFTAHLTLGRINRKLNLNSFFKKYKKAFFGSFVAESFELMHSELKKGGPEYSVLWSSRRE